MFSFPVAGGDKHIAMQDVQPVQDVQAVLAENLQLKEKIHNLENTMHEHGLLQAQINEDERANSGTDQGMPNVKPFTLHNELVNAKLAIAVKPAKVV